LLRIRSVVADRVAEQYRYEGGVRAATGHEKGRSGQVTGRPMQKMHVAATIAEI